MSRSRRRFLTAAAVSLAASDLATIGYAGAQSETMTLMPSAGTHTSFPPIKHVNAGLLNVAYAEVGPADGPPVVLLHGWPYDIHSYVDVAPLLAAKGHRVIVPFLRGYGTTRFLSDRTLRNGQEAAVALDIIALMDALGYAKYRHDFANLIWTIVSPNWKFDDATFDRTAAAFNNPDHVAIVIYDYRWRISLVNGEPQYAALAKQLAAGPQISVPSITIASDFDGANAPGTAYRAKFTGKYAHRIFKGIGHNVPQEAPQAFAQAVIDVDTL